MVIQIICHYYFYKKKNFYINYQKIKNLQAWVSSNKYNYVIGSFSSDLKINFAYQLLSE